ncbi:extracellular solute-binding protein [Paracoccus sp. S-4012]|nr:extracellular solute-binding protein [Paracoccus sp. S-4012]
MGTALGSAALAGDVRIMWYSDGNEGEVMEDLVARFRADHPEINLTLENVAYQVIKEQLPIQLAAGEGPDIARITDLKKEAPHFLDLTPYLRDPDYWRENFGAQLDWMRPDRTDIIPGFMTQLTLTGGFANATLFEQAGVPLPGPEATWDEWVEAAARVAESQQLEAAIAIDRSGHRITGPMISEGAKLIGEDGMPAPLDDAARGFLTKLIGWTEDGRNLRDVWVSAAGATYRPAADEFINATVPYYYAGSWQVANLSATVGDAFDWVATGSPCGVAGCTGIPGGAALVAIRSTPNPEEVATVMEWFAQEDIVREFSERTLFLPAHKAVVEKGGLDFQTDDENARAALNAFVAATGQLTEEAQRIPAWTPASDVYAALAKRLGEAMAGELSTEDALARIDSDIAEAMTAAAQ